ncbi:MAG: argininosuccinate lyase [Gemmatimonadaceae bacterium]
MTARLGHSQTESGHRYWGGGGRFATHSAAEFDALNRSTGVDFRLWPHDLRLSNAWAMALWNAGVLSLDESERIAKGLDAVGARLVSGEAAAPSDEDVHTLIDRMLHEEIGDLASKLHTGRSRNDQVATATRMWTSSACTRLDAAIRSLQQVMIERATRLGDAIMPSYTHLQRAQPVAAAHWMLAHFWPLDRDRLRLAAASRAASVLPLGSGAVAGCAYPVSRVLLQGSLGFTALSENSMDAVSDRDFAAEVLFALSMLGVHLSRLAEDLILFGSSEFGFVQFDDAFSSGSSMMPQKRNPDALEIARAGSARSFADLTSLLMTLKALPTGYNKDLQDDKRVLFDAVDSTLLVLPAVTGTLATLSFRTERMADAVSSAMLATDLADYLVDKGLSFRAAHKVVGGLVRESEERGVELHQLTLDSFRAAHELFTGDLFDVLSPRRSLNRREAEGGTGPRALGAQLESARAALGGAAGERSARTPANRISAAIL